MAASVVIDLILTNKPSHFQKTHVVETGLTILTGKNYFIQLNTKMTGWLLLTFLICLHNQLISITRVKSADV